MSTLYHALCLTPAGCTCQVESARSAGVKGYLVGQQYDANKLRCFLGSVKYKTKTGSELQNVQVLQRELRTTKTDKVRKAMTKIGSVPERKFVD